MAVLGLFIILFKIKGDNESLRTFLSFRNLQVLFHDITITGVISLGALLIIISGGIDLSVGSVAALVTVIGMQAFRIIYMASGSMTIASLVAISTGISVAGPCKNGWISCGFTARVRNKLSVSLAAATNKKWRWDDYCINRPTSCSWMSRPVA